MKKKFVVSALSVMLALAVTACGSSSSDSSSSTTTAAATEAAAVEETEVEAEIEETEAETEAAATKGEVFLEPFNTSPTIEETVLWDEDDVRITAIDLSYSSWSADLNLLLENNSDEKLSFRCQTGTSYVAVNGYMIDDGYFTVDIEPGESAEKTVSLGTTELNLHGINEIATIQIGIALSDENYNYTYLEPQTIRTSIADGFTESDTYAEILNNGIFEQITGYDLTYNSSDEIYNKSDISVSSEALFESGDGEGIIFGYEINNQSDYNINFETYDVTINGTVCYEGLWSSDFIAQNTRRVNMMDIDRLVEKSEDETLIDDGIDTISFTIKIKNEDYVEALSPEEVTIEIK